MQSIVRVERSSLAAALHLVAKEDVRYYLNAVCIEAQPDRTVVIATDGHSLIAIPSAIEANDPNQVVGRQQFIIDRADVKRILAAHSKKLLAIVFRFNDDGMFDTSACVGKCVDAQYPNFRSVIKSAANPNGEKAQFDPEILARVQKAFKEFSGCARFHLFHNGNSGATAYYSGHPDIACIVMPWRMETDAKPSFDWVDEPAPETAAEPMTVAA